MEPDSKILLVDDDPEDLSMLAELLESRLPGLPVLVATSGPKGLDILRQESPCVIVSDYRMPGMDGVEFLREAKKLASQARLVMLSGTPDLFATESGRSEAFTVLAKPIHPDLFVDLIQRMAKRRKTG